MLFLSKSIFFRLSTSLFSTKMLINFISQWIKIIKFKNSMWVAGQWSSCFFRIKKYKISKWPISQIGLFNGSSFSFPSICLSVCPTNSLVPFLVGQLPNWPVCLPVHLSVYLVHWSHFWFACLSAHFFICFSVFMRFLVSLFSDRCYNVSACRPIRQSIRFFSGLISDEFVHGMTVWLKNTSFHSFEFFYHLFYLFGWIKFSNF